MCVDISAPPSAAGTAITLTPAAVALPRRSERVWNQPPKLLKVDSFVRGHLERLLRLDIFSPSFPEIEVVGGVGVRSLRVVPGQKPIRCRSFAGSELATTGQLLRRRGNAALQSRLVRFLGGLSQTAGTAVRIEQVAATVCTAGCAPACATCWRWGDRRHFLATV